MVEFAVEGINNFHNNPRSSTTQLWFNVQGLLIATSNISKLLWSYDKRQEIPEVTHIKYLLDINDYSKIKPRFFRNLFEHYDEHLIKWGKNRTSDMIQTANITPRDFNLGLPDIQTFKHYYNDVNVIAFQNKEYELQPVIKEVARIYQRILEIGDQIHN